MNSDGSISDTDKLTQIIDIFEGKLVKLTSVRFHNYKLFFDKQGLTKIVMLIFSNQ